MASFLLTWGIPPSANNGTITIEYRELGSSIWTLYPVPAFPAGTTSATVAGLNDNTIYEFRVVNNCLSGDTSPGNVKELVTLTCPVLNVTSTSYNTIDFEVVELGGSIANYHVKLFNVGGTVPIQVVDLSPTGVVANLLTGSFTGLVAGTSYEIRVDTDAIGTYALFTKTCTKQSVSTQAYETFTIQARNLSTITFSKLYSSTVDYTINWGDGSPVQTFTAGANTPSHTYTAPYTGNIVVTSTDLSTVTELALTAITPAIQSPFTTSIATSELNKLDALTTLYTGDYTYISGYASDLPVGLLECTILQTDLDGDMVDFPTGLTILSVYGNNTIYGDISDLPSGLLQFNLGGANTVGGTTVAIPAGLQTSGITQFYIMGSNNITGDVDKFPKSILSLTVGGLNTLSGVLGNLPTSLQYCAIFGDLPGGNTISGAISTIPATVTNIQIAGKNTISGNIEDLNDGVTYCEIFGNNNVGGTIDSFSGTSTLETLSVDGNNSIAGDIVNLPSTIKYLTIQGNNTISGDITDFSATIQEITIEGGNGISGSLSSIAANTSITKFILSGLNIISGDLADIPVNCTYFAATGTNTISSYTTGSWHTNMRNVTVVPTSALSSVVLNDILTDLATTTWTSPGTVSLKGTANGSTPALKTALQGVSGVTSVTITP